MLELYNKIMITLSVGDIGIISVLTSSIASILIYIWNLKNNTFDDRLSLTREELLNFKEKNQEEHKNFHYDISEFQNIENRVVKIETNVEWIKTFLETKK